MEGLRIASTLNYDVAANWKVICENYNECYHCGPVHPELCRLVPAFRENGGANLDWQRGIPHRAGADTFSSSGTSVRRSFPELNEDEQQRHKGELVYPNLLLSVAREHVAAFLLEPLGPMRTRISCHFLFEPYEMAQQRFDPSEVVEFWDLVNRQDWAICEAVQARERIRPATQSVGGARQTAARSAHAAGGEEGVDRGRRNLSLAGLRHAADAGAGLRTAAATAECRSRRPAELGHGADAGGVRGADHARAFQCRSREPRGRDQPLVHRARGLVDRRCRSICRHTTALG